MNNIPSGTIEQNSSNQNTTANVTNTDNTNQITNVNTEDTTAHVTKAYSRGINEGRERTIKEFQKQGINLVLDSNGEVDFKATISNIGKQFQESTKESTVHNSKINSDAIAQIEALQAKLDIFEKKVQQAESEKQQYIIDSEIATSFSNFPLVEGIGKKVVTLFKTDYEIKQLTNGEIHIYKDNKLLLNNKGDVMSVNEAVNKFISDNKYLVKAQGRGSSPSQSVVSTGRKQVTQQDMIEGKVSIEDLKKGVDFIDADEALNKTYVGNW